jgi:hypothetical protein
MTNWKDSVKIVPASEAFPNGDPAPQYVESYRVYVPHGYDGKPYDPYQDGVVIEKWTDGRYYIIDCNDEQIHANLELVEETANRLCGENGWIDESGNLTADAKTIDQLAVEAKAFTDEQWGSEEQIAAQNAFTERAERMMTPPAMRAFEIWCLKATTDEIIDEGLRLAKLQPTMRPVRWSFDNDPTVYDGFTDDSHWNGWLNVWVREETHKRVIETSDPESGLAEIEPDGKGYYCYADGFTAQEVPTDDEIVEEALHSACASIQNRLFVDTGDVAGMFFTGDNAERFSALMKAYIAAERAEVGRG